MAEVTNSGSGHQVYKVQSSEGLLAQVSKVIFVLTPRGICTAGFSERGDLLMISHNDYKKSLPTWILDFFEHEFLNEELLASPHKVIAAFVATEKTMLIPDILFNEKEADKWMRQLHFIEQNEIVSSYQLKEDKAYYMYAWPAAIKSLIGRYFTKAKVLPFSSYQFYKPFKSECSMQCSITSDSVYATLYKDRQLHWHQVFTYQTTEDIAYHIKHVCQFHNINISELSLQCTTGNKTLAGVVTELSQYFNELKDGTGNVPSNDRNWTGTIYLLQQLYACAL
ncbi:MAG: DUF3822 family protein [Bacteroidetes bacterium]|nr:DUF3822 family protein [Bacteroidota bacterium]